MLLVQAKYRTEEGWGTVEYPVILVEEGPMGFIISCYQNTAMAHVGKAQAGIFDVMEYEVYENEDAN